MGRGRSYAIEFKFGEKFLADFAKTKNFEGKKSSNIAGHPGMSLALFVFRKEVMT